jgi:dihydrofolate reductase
MIVSAIVAVSANLVIGRDNGIPWYLPADLQYFKRVTLGHHIIMGRKSFMSIGRPLPGRTNIVITRNPFFVASGVLVVNDIEAALDMAYEADEAEVFIIGGGEIYRQSMAYWDRIYLTEVNLETAGDVFFPEPEWSRWQLISEEHHIRDEKNEYEYCYKVFERVAAASGD